MNRLTDIYLGTTHSQIVYDPLGRMTTKQADGQAVFANASFAAAQGQPAQPHAMKSAETAEDVFPSATQEITYTGFDKVKTITEGGNTLVYTYGYDRQRIFMEEHANGIDRTKRYVGSCEFITKTENNITTESILTYLTSPTGVFAVVVTNADGKHYLHYILKDHLGSWSTITDCNGNVEQELSYDAWGNRRDPDTWRRNWYNPALEEPMFDRGYTGHEHMTAFGLINMNGRCYDPVMSSFLSVDAYVQSPDNSQNFNRYSYCLNNPLKYIDPSGWTVIGGGMGSHTTGAAEWGTNYAPVYEPRDFTNAYYLYNMALYGSFSGCGGGGGGGCSYGGYSMGDLYNTYGYQVTHYANSVYNYCFRSTQKELIRNWQYNPNKTTSLDLEEAGIRYLSIGVSVLGDGTQSSCYTWKSGNGKIYYAEALNEYIGSNKIDSYCLSFQPSGRQAKDIYNSWHKANIIAQTISISKGTIAEGIEMAAKSYHNVSLLKVNSGLSKAQYVSALSKEGYALMKINKIAGRACGYLSAAVSTSQAIDYYKEGGKGWAVGVKSGVDLVMIGIGMYGGPIGFGISMGYLVLDWATGGFGINYDVKP